MRNLSPPVEAEKSKEQNRPVELYTVHLDDGVTLHLAGYDEDVEFFDEHGAPVVYRRFGIKRTPIRHNVDTRVDETTVRLDNVTREMSSYVAHTDLNGRRCRITKVFLDALDDPNNAVVVFDGLMDAPALTESTMSVTVRSRLDTLDVVTPRRRYRRLCNWKFGSPECGVDLASVTVTGTVQGIGSDGKTLTLSGRSEPTGHYTDGVLTIGGESRRVDASDGAEITVDYPFGEDVAVGDDYALRRGCNKTYDESCVGRFDNGARFGGFLSVPSED